MRLCTKSENLKPDSTQCLTNLLLIKTTINNNMADNGNSNPTPGTSDRGQAIVPPNHPNAVQDNAAANLAPQIINNTNLSLNYEHSQIQEILGKPGKDSINAMAFIKRVDELDGCCGLQLLLGLAAKIWANSIIMFKSITQALLGPCSNQCSNVNLLPKQMTSSWLMAFQTT
jgi:hypothetical protein